MLVKLGDGRSQCSLMCSSLVVQEPFGQAPQSCCLFFILRLPNQWDQVPKIRPHNVVRPVQAALPLLGIHIAVGTECPVFRAVRRTPRGSAAPA